MLEFNLDGDLFTGFDASNAYQRVAGGDPSAYGLSQQKNLQPGSASDPLSAQDPISALADDDQNQQAATLKPHRPALWNQGTPSQHHTSQPAGVAADPSQADQSSDHQQDNSDPAQIDQLTGGHQDGRAITSAPQPASAERLELAPADPADLNNAPHQLDPLTGDTEEGFFGFMPIPTIFEIDPDVLSYLGERAEVNNLLAEDRFDRDQSTGTETFYNLPFGSGYSANEGGGYDITDSRTNAADIGTVAYRDDKKVIGTIGTTSAGFRDANDYFSFYAGKCGTYDLSLSNLGANVGLALYNDTGSLVTWSNKSGTQNENISTFLNEGHYTSRIYSYNTSAANNNGISAFKLDISRQADCFEQTIENSITDNSVENAALNSIKYDYNFDRNDVIGILKSAGDYGSVTGTERTDLRQFWNTFSGTMRADIAGLSKKVVFSDDSNAWYTGYDSIRNELGNLEAGTSTQNLNLLIGKHMLGTDRPEIHRNSSGNLSGSYTEAGGSLFMNDVSFDDVDQGNMGTCYLLAGLAGTANDKPSMIRDMFTDNGDGTYSVRFYTNGQADYVTVDNMMATRSNGAYLYANDGGDNGSQDLVSGNNELWVALAEKAYAQLNESGRLGQQEATNSYAGIRGGSSALATEQITGLETKSEGAIHNWLSWFGVSDGELQELVNGNNIVTIGGFNSNASTDDDGDGAIDWKSTSSTNIGRAVQSHAYSIVGYNATTGRYDIRNPWDTANLSLTHAQLRQLGANIRYSLS